MVGFSRWRKWARAAGNFINGNNRRKLGRRNSSRGESRKIEELEGRQMLTLLGQQLFPADNAWNQNISNAPVAANSAAIISNIGANTRIHADWGEDSPANGTNPLYGIPVNVVHGNSIAKINVIIDNYPGESEIVPVPIPANAIIEGDYQSGPNPNTGYGNGDRGDSHLIVWDADNNIAYELFGVTRPTDPQLFPNTNGVELAHTDGKWHAAQQTVWNMNTNQFRTLGHTSADAAGISILAGLVRPDEGRPVSQGGQGAINHALRVTLPTTAVNPQYIYPATHVVNTVQNANKLPFGGRLRLANTPTVNTMIAAMPPQSQIIARAMQQYGLIVSDIGTAMYVTGTSSIRDFSNNITATWNMSDILASNGLQSLRASHFEVVDLTPIVTGLSAPSGASGSIITVNGKNFSGAGGRLAVLFGSVAATTVNVLSDSQISVVVPQFSGTVDVRVRSGIIATDPNNPNRNVTNPVYGYGTSAITTADRFKALLPGDLNQDGTVNGADIAPLLKALANPTVYLSTYPVTPADLPIIGDVNRDGSFNNRDIQALLNLVATTGGGSGSLSNTNDGGANPASANPATVPTTRGLTVGASSSRTSSSQQQLRPLLESVRVPVLLNRETQSQIRIETLMPKTTPALAIAIKQYKSLYPDELPTRRTSLLASAGVSQEIVEDDGLAATGSRIVGHFESGGTVQSGCPVSFSAAGPEI